MRATNTWLLLTCALALGGCFGKSGDDTGAIGTTNAQAAEALTKAVSFTGGSKVDGLLPSGTSSDASLLPSGGGALAPGMDSLLSFDITPSDASVDSALIQFEGASAHFTVKRASFGTGAGAGAGAVDGGTKGGAADGGTGAGSAGASKHVALSYTVNDTVCQALCDTTYELNVVLALGLPKSGVSKHVTTTVTLDCTETGNHARCGSKNGSVAANPKPPSDDSSLGAQYQQAFEALVTAACACDPDPAACANDTGLTANWACTGAAIDKHMSELRAPLQCEMGLLATSTQCLNAAKCDPTAMDACPTPFTSSSSSADASVPDDTCGRDSISPEAQLDLDACKSSSGTSSGSAGSDPGSAAGAGGARVDSGVPIDPGTAGAAAGAGAGTAGSGAGTGCKAPEICQDVASLGVVSCGVTSQLPICDVAGMNCGVSGGKCSDIGGTLYCFMGCGLP